MKIIVNPDETFVAQFKEKIKLNDGYCPCRIWHKPENKCMCKEFREQKTTGWCHCHLYYKNN